MTAMSQGEETGIGNILLLQVKWSSIIPCILGGFLDGSVVKKKSPPAKMGNMVILYPGRPYMPWGKLSPSITTVEPML